MKVGSDVARGMAPVAHADAGVGEPLRSSLEKPRLEQQDLSRLDKHGLNETPLKHAVTTLAGLVAPPHQAIDDDRPAGRPVDEHSLDDYVRAALGMKHHAANIDPALAPYLDELSKAESPEAEPVTESSFRLLSILYMADQVPGPAGYGQFSREAFMGWLGKRLDLDRFQFDCIPDTYFAEVRVRRNPETGFTNRCVVEFGDGAEPVEVRSMRRADLRGAHLRGVDLRDVDLREANLQGANLEGAQLQGANLEDANLQHANLEGANLEGADLRGAYLAGAQLRRAHLSVTPELAVDLALGWTSRNLTGTRLLLSTDEAASSCQGRVAARMARWNAAEFDWTLNHRNNDGRGTLKAIAGLDDSCRDTKRALMRAVVGELDRVRTTSQVAAVEALIPSLGDVLFEDPEYLRGHDAFSAWLCAGLLGNGSTLLDAELTGAALDAVGGHVARVLEDATHLPEAERVGAITRHSVAIYQVLYAMRERVETAESPEVLGKWLSQSRAIHEQYCRILGDALPTLMGEGGVYENERALFPDDDAFPLISADGQACVIMTDPYYRQLVLGGRSRAPEEDGNVIWDQLRCVQGSAGTFPASVNDPNDPSQGGTRRTASTAAVLEQFPLLSAALHREKATAAQDRMLALAGLPAGGDLTLLERFTAALQRSHMIDPSEKMTDGRHQAALIDVFATNIEDRGGQAHLAAGHFTALGEQWRADTDEAFAFRLLCMAALYTNYSSSHIFGEEYDSPNALRSYAEALLRKVHERAPGLLPSRELGEWVGKLRGKGNLFQCTAVLYGMESTNLLNILRQEPPNSPLHRVWNEMIPLAWREGRAAAP